MGAMSLFEFPKKLFTKNKSNEYDFEKDSSFDLGIKSNLYSKQIPILRAIIATGERLEIDVLLDLLTGTITLELDSLMLEASPYFGRLEGCNRSEIKSTIDQLIRSGYIRFHDTKTKILVVTTEGTLLLEGKIQDDNKETTTQQKKTKKYNENIKPDRSKRYPLEFGEYVEKVRAEGNENAYRIWSKHEENLIVAEFNSGKSISQIAVEHKRTPGAIKQRLVKLGVIHR